MSNGESDKRRQQRLRITSPLRIIRTSGQQIEGTQVDISLLGYRFISTALLEAGERVTTTLLLPSGKKRSAEGTIKSTSQNPPYEYGVVFTLETVEQLIKEGVQPI